MTDPALSKEQAYYKIADPDKVKQHGQYFTPEKIARFMVRWVIKDADQVLDPAAGNHIFYREAQRIKPDCHFTGYEIDQQMADYFQIQPPYPIILEDYLLSDWQKRYDAIICNPPYNRFQAIPKRKQILEKFYKETGVRYSAYTNQSILFLLKSIHQLSDEGRLAFIMPAEFLHARYGEAVKARLIQDKLLRAVLFFDTNIFPKVITTSCILLLDKKKKNAASFFYLEHPDCIEQIDIEQQSPADIHFYVKYSMLEKTDKWLNVFNSGQTWQKEKCVQLSYFAQVSRGLATGHNEFFLFSDRKIRENNLEARYFRPCIAVSRDVCSPVLTKEDFDHLISKQRRVFLLDANDDYDKSENLLAYLNRGLQDNVHKRYLPGKRKPWFSMENKKVSPIWIGTAGRQGIKIIRNIAGVINLTAFHSLHMKPCYGYLTNLLFCYLLTPAAQTLLAENRKIMGNGLTKYQPNDLAQGSVLDLTLVSKQDRDIAEKLYTQLVDNHDNQPVVKEIVNQLNDLFQAYLNLNKKS